ERRHRLYRIGQSRRKVRGSSHIGVQLAGAEQGARSLRLESRYLDLVRIIGRIDGKLVAAPDHGRDRQYRHRDDEYLPHIHRDTPARAQPRSAFTTFSSASASFGEPWKMISPRSIA